MPILPIVLDGTTTMVRRGWLMNWGNHITIKVLKPISKEEVAERDVKDVMAEVHERMVAALAEVRAEKNK